MKIEGQIKNPITLKITSTESTIFIGDLKAPLNTGMMFNDEHYGFNLITEENGIINESIYSTQCSLLGVRIEKDSIDILENNKKSYWKFTKSGRMINSAHDDFTVDYLKELVPKKETHYEEPILKEPLRIKLTKDPKKSYILKDEYTKENTPLYPGRIILNNHYGFILITDDKEIPYPTQNRIDSVSIDSLEKKYLRIIEDGKDLSWLFELDGELIQSGYIKEDRKYRI